MAASTEAGKMLQQMVAGGGRRRGRARGRHAAAASRIMHLRSKAKPDAGAPLGQGGRFAALEQKLADRPGVKDPGALAAAIGRRKYGAAKFAKLGAKGK